MTFSKFSDVVQVKDRNICASEGADLYRYFLINALICVAFFMAFTASSQTLTPRADAGADRAVITDTVLLLDGSASTLEGDQTSDEPLNYSWAFISGPNDGGLSSADTPRPSVNLDQAGTYRFALTVSNSAGEASVDEVEIRAADNAENARPVADAGMARLIETGVAARLDGSASYAPSAQRLSFEWTLLEQPAGSLAVLEDSTSPFPVLTPDLAGDYSAQLIITDSQGAVSAPQTVILSTENIAPLAFAGVDRVAQIGEALRFDPEGSYDANGDRLEAAWSVLYAPIGSSAQLSEDAGGRYALTPDMAGDYVAQLSVTDSEGAVSYDTVLINAGSADAIAANVAPIADAGSDGAAVAGTEIGLDGSRSSDANGDRLSYQWSVLYKRADSFSQPLSPSVVRSAFTPDIDALYILQLAVTDSGGITDYDTLVLSPDGLSPRAVSGGPDAASDGAIVNMAAVLDASSSVTGSGSMTGLSYEWSILALSKGTSEIFNAGSVTTNVAFPEERPGEITDASSIAAIGLLKDYTLISFGELNAHAESLGRVLVGGDVQGPSTTFGTALVPANEIDVLTVIGEIKGGAKNINNGGNVRIKGKAKSRLNFNGGGQLIKDTSLSIFSAEQQLKNLSDDLRALPVNSTISLPSGQAGPAELRATPNLDGVAVFEIADGNALFKNNNVQQIEVDANGAKTIIVNVGGDNINFNKGNFTGAVTSDDLSQKIIWNFYEASQLKIFRSFEGSILAPNAYVHNESKIDGAVIGARVLNKAPIGFPVYGGTGLDIVELDPTHYALAQLAVTDTANPGFGPSYATTVLTTGNKRPVAQIVQSGGPDPLTPGIEVSFNGASSSDGDNDGLSYSWSLLSKPEGSQSVLSNVSSANSAVTPDAVGFYVVQLIVSDGALLSRPTTLIFEAQNTPPTANAGAAQTVFKNEVVTLDASASSDPDGDDITYLWMFTDKPEGSQAVLSDAESVAPTFTADLKGEYRLKLVVNDGIADSESDSVTITVQNRAPIAVATGTAEGFVGDVIMLSGAGSSDPDGDALTYLWTVQGPEGSMAALSDPAAISPMFTPDLGGVYNFTLVVNDGEVSSPPASFVSTISDANRAPILAPVGDRSVALGDKLSFQLSATDPDGDNLYYSITQLPLPQGASFDVNTGIFSFKPESLTPDSLSLTLGVSDSALTDAETITITVTNILASPTTEYTGRIVDVTTGEPITGVVIMAEGQTAVTGEDGVFTLTDLPAGPVAIWIVADDGTELSQDGTAYGSTQIGVNLIENVSNTAETDIRLSPISVSEPVTAGETTTVQNAALGVTLDIPEDGLVDMAGDLYTGVVGLTALSAEQANTLPPNVVPCQLFSLEPKTIRTVKPVTLTIGNYDNLPAGAIVDVWVFDGTDFTVVGSGTVSSDASQVVAVLENLRGGQLIALAPRPSIVEITNDQPRDIYVPGILNEGNYSTSYATPSYTSLGSDRALTFVYNSTSANPSPIISSISTLVENSGTPESISQVVKIGDAVLSLQSQIDLTTTPEGLEQFVQAGTFDASELPTGTYPVSFMSVSQYACSSVSSSVETDISINNQTESPIGTGWTIAEVSRLQIDDDGRVTIVNGDGTISEFSPEEELGSVRETFAADVGSDNVPVVADIDGNGTVDLVAMDDSRGTLRFFINTDGTNFVEDVASELTVARATSLPQRPAGRATDTGPLRAADFDNDGMLEFVIDSNSRNAIQIVQKVGDVYEITKSISTSDTIRETQIADFDNDGFQDILTFSGSRLRFYTNDGTGNFTLATTQFRSGIDIGTDDIDGDGRVDVVLLSGSTARFRFNEGGLTVREVNVSLPRSANRFLGQLVQIGDVDLDGDNDIIVSTLPNVTYIENLGNRTFRTVELVRPAGFGNADNITLADVTGDGLLDVLVDERTPQPRYALFKKLVDGDYAPAEAVVFGHAIGESLVTDVDGDGFQDLVSKARFQLYVDFGQPPNNGNFNSPFGDFSSLVRNDDGTYSRRFTNGTVVTYSAAGLQTATTDRNGNETLYGYDADGRLASVTDPTGQVTNLAYGPDGLLETVTDPAGRSSSFTHNDVGDLVQITDPEDQPTRFDYDEQSRLVSETSKRDLTTVNSYGAGGRYAGSEFADGSSIGLSVARTLGLPDLGGDTSNFVAVEDRMSVVTDGRGNVTETEVNEFGSPVRVLDALGRETLYERNNNNLVTAVIQPSSVTVSGTLRAELTYDIRGNLLSRTEAVGTALERSTFTEYEAEFSRPVKITDADGFETLMEYDEFGNQIRTIDPLGGETAMAYNARGRVVSLRDKNNNLTEFEYDNFSRLAFTTDANNIRQQMVRDEAGNVIELIDDVSGPKERRKLTSYDGLNRKLTETAADGGVTTYSYNGNNNVISIIDPTGVAETNSYDERNRLLSTTQPSTGTKFIAYDEDGNISQLTDAAGEETTYLYDAMDRLVSSTDSRGQIRAFAYDVRDNMTAVTDARANISLISYDALDRVSSRSNPLGEVWEFGYDHRDNRVLVTKPDGVVINSTFDSLSRLQLLTSDDLSRAYNYDAQDNLLSANENSNGTDGPQLVFTYDVENRVATASVSNLLGSSALNNSFNYEYDALDRRASLLDSFGGRTIYGYDTVDRLTNVTTPTDDIFETNYDTAGRILNRSASNGTQMLREYEALTGRLMSQSQRANGTSFNAFDYSYTERGNIGAIAETGEVIREKSYGYDELERLTEVDVAGATSLGERYLLDSEGNRVSSHLSNTHVTDEANRLTEDAQYTYLYDLNGNLVSKLAKPGNGQPNWTYRYDALDQLVEVRQDANIVERYRYDALGRRSLIETNNDLGGFDRLGIVNDVSNRSIDISTDADGEVIIVSRYTHGSEDDEPLLLETFDETGDFDAAYTYHADHLGSIRFLTGASGDIANTYQYDSYGRPQFGVTEVFQPFQYTGREYDQAIGLYHYRARQYDPETGRFLQEDPIGFSAGDLNVYRYVKSNPLSYTDPSGLLIGGEYATGAANQLQTAPAIALVGQGINCIFNRLASVLDGINAVQQSGGQVQDVQYDVISPCTAEVTASYRKVIFGFEDIESLGEMDAWREFLLNKLFFFGIKRLDVRFNSLGSLRDRPLISLTARPAYPSTWRDLPGPRI